MTELIARLEKRGAIVRRPDSVNGRILRADLTPAGVRLLERGTELAIRLERELFADFEPRDVEQLNRLFAALIAKAETHSCHPKLRRFGKHAAKPRRSQGTSKAHVRRRAAATG